MQIKEGDKVEENGIRYLVKEVLSDRVTLLRVDLSGPVEFEHERDLSLDRVQREFSLVR